MKPEAGIYCCLSFCLPACLPAVPVEPPATRLCVCLTVSSSPFSFHHFPLLTVLCFLPFSLFLSLLGSPSHLRCCPLARAWTGNRGRATCCPSTSQRWKFDPWGPCLAGRDDRWWPERRGEPQPRNETTTAVIVLIITMFWCFSDTQFMSYSLTVCSLMVQWGRNSCAIVTYYVL